MAKYPGRLESNNPKEFGIVPASQIAGTKTVATLSELLNISDAILSESKGENPYDALGQIWYVSNSVDGEIGHYILINWANRHKESGWTKISFNSFDISIGENVGIGNHVTIGNYAYIGEEVDIRVSQDTVYIGSASVLFDDLNLLNSIIKKGNKLTEGILIDYNNDIIGTDIIGTGVIGTGVINIKKIIDDRLYADIAISNNVSILEGSDKKLVIQGWGDDIYKSINFGWGDEIDTTIFEKSSLGYNAKIGESVNIDGYVNIKCKQLGFEFGQYDKEKVFIPYGFNANNKVDKVDGKGLSTNDFNADYLNKLRNAGLYGRMNNLGTAYGVRELFKLTTTSTDAEIRSAIKPTDVDLELTKDILDYCVRNGSMIYDVGTTHHIVVHKTLESMLQPTWDLIQIDSGAYVESSGANASVKVGTPHVKVITLQFNISSSTWKVLRVLDKEIGIPRVNALEQVANIIRTYDEEPGVVVKEKGISIYYQQGETPLHLYSPATSCTLDGDISIKNATIGDNANIGAGVTIDPDLHITAENLGGGQNIDVDSQYFKINSDDKLTLSDNTKKKIDNISFYENSYAVFKGHNYFEGFGATFDNTDDNPVFWFDGSAPGYETCLGANTNIGNNVTIDSDITLTAETVNNLDNSVISEEVINNPALEDITLPTREEIKKDSFIDIWKATCRSAGGYNKDTGYFELNGLTDITYEQALAIFAVGARQSSTLAAAYIQRNIRTHLPRIGTGQAAQAEDTFYNCSSIESVQMENIKLNGGVFHNCSKLRYINNLCPSIYNLNASVSRKNFIGCVALEELKGTIRSNNGLDLSDSPLLSLASFQFMLNNAYNTATITITVHPDVYAKITGDTTNDAFNNLTDDEKEQWTALVDAATAKNIQFATIE